MPQSWMVVSSGRKSLAVALLEMGAVLEEVVQKAPQLAVPVHHRPANSVAGQPCAKLTDWQRAALHVVAERPRLARQVLEQLALNGVAELVEVVHQEVRIGVAKRPAFESHHLQAGGAFAELARDDAADHAEANEDHVYPG